MITASQMGHKSWEARKKKYGDKKALLILKEAAKVGAKKTNEIKRAKRLALDKVA